MEMHEFLANNLETRLISRAFAMMELGRTFFALAILGIAAAQSTKPVLELETTTIASHIVDADLSITQLIKKHGYHAETHHVTTEDGYILEMHRITGPSRNSSAKGKPPVLLIHPLLSSSFDWVVSGPGKAFGYVLADEGYDVWLGNIRGNSFGRKHVKYTAVDKEFWQFSWHETGVYDLPAMIDYILAATHFRKVTYVGHSQGSTAFWVMAHERPEYELKIQAMFALAPVAYMTHTRSPFYQVLARFGHKIEKLARLLGYWEFEASSKIVKDIAKVVCDDDKLTQLVCSNIMFLLGGVSHDQLNATMLPTILSHVPAGGSVKQILHFFQVLKSRRFQKYDYGTVKNLLTYKHVRPPTYKLANIKVDVYLYFSEGDRFATGRDVDRLSNELGNVVGKFRVPNEKFAHLDFMWGMEAKQLVYDKIVGQINRYYD